jgi:hypothetical protein
MVPRIAWRSKSLRDQQITSLPRRSAVTRGGDLKNRRQQESGMDSAAETW